MAFSILSLSFDGLFARASIGEERVPEQLDTPSASTSELEAQMESNIAEDLILESASDAASDFTVSDLGLKEYCYS